MLYTNSSLVKYTKISPNRNSPRNHVIDTITIHCYVGQASIESMGGWFANSGAQASSNYGIGADGRVGLFVEEKDRSWCTSSRENDNRAVTIECACDAFHPYKINDKVYTSLINLVADICRRNNIKKLVWSTDKNVRMNHLNGCNMTVHRDYANKACPGDYIYQRLGTIANEVNKKLGIKTETKVETKTDEIKWYRVRKTWPDVASQLGAYEILENAKKNCPIGYTVFNSEGKTVYTPVDTLSYVSPSKYPSGIPQSKESYIEAVGSICRELQKETNILASVVVAQCCLETGFGLAEDCKILMQANNLLGMKCSLLNSTWQQWTVWDGEKVTKQTPEYYNGKLTYITDSFRKYRDYYDCIRDYEMFLLHVRNGKGFKYASIAGMKDPALVIRRIRIGTGTVKNPEGYCTDPAYEGKILNLIKQYNLDRFNANVKEVPQQKPTAILDKYVVQRSLDDTKYRIGAYHILENAKKEADKNWGYKVFDIEVNKLIYEPKLAKWQKFVAYLIWMDQLVQDDILAKLPWLYKNKNTSELSRTFVEARKNKNRYTNCVTAVQWGLLWAEVVNSNRDGIQWYGNNGIVWVNKNAEKNAKKYFHIINVKNKTLAQCIEDGTVVPGDIITYVDLAHTNVYIGNNLSFDAGHANCSGSGEGAKFTKWISATPYKQRKVATILRLK